MKRLLSLMLALVVIIGTLALPVWADDSAPEQNVGAVYSIPADAQYVQIDGKTYNVVRSYAELKAVMCLENAQITYTILANDIDCTGITISGGELVLFPGSVVEGNGFSILNIPDCPGEGIFTLMLGEAITFRNLTLGEKANPITIDYSGAQTNLGIISATSSASTVWENCHVYGKVSTDALGGVSLMIGNGGTGDHTFTNCTFTGDILMTNSGTNGVDCAFLVGATSDGALLTVTDCKFYGSAKSTNNTGTIVGWCQAIVYATNCENYANITAHDQSTGFAAGFVANISNSGGTKHQTVQLVNCVNYATITGRNPGGMISQSRSSRVILTDCINFGTINGGNGAGMIGVSSGNYSGRMTLTNCLNAGTINGTQHSGGMLGYGHGKINMDGCINIGSVTTPASAGAGGLIGRTRTDYIKNCYSLGKVSGTVGAITGMTYDGENPVLENNFYLESIKSSFGSNFTYVGEANSISQEDAMAVLEEKYPNIVFIAEKDGSISTCSTNLRAVQNTNPADDKFSVRLLSTITTLNLSQVGFEGSVKHIAADGTETPISTFTLAETGTTNVHKTVLAGSVSVSASELLGNYIYTYKLLDLPATGTIVIDVAPVTKINAATTIIGAAYTITFENGAYAGSYASDAEDGGNAVVTPLDKYTPEGSVDGDGVIDPNNTGIVAIDPAATTYEKDGVTYTVVRTFAEFKDALKGKEEVYYPNAGHPVPDIANKAEYRYVMQPVNIILADDLNGEGANMNLNDLDVFQEETLLVGEGSIIDGNGFALYNYTGFGLFKLEASETDATTVIKNLTVGSAAQPLTMMVPSNIKSAGLFANYAMNGAETEWINCKIYANLYGMVSGCQLGAFIGKAEGEHTFTNCEVNGSVASNSYAASLISYINDGNTVVNIENCTNNATIYGAGNAGGFLGTLKMKAATGKVTITDSVNNGSIRGGEAGGFLSKVRSDITITNCVNNGDITGVNYAGGMMAWYTTDNVATAQLVTISNSTNNGDVTCRYQFAGGVTSYVGKSDATTNTNCSIIITNVVNTGDIVALVSDAGGIIGHNFASAIEITGVLNTGDVTGAYAGGLIGKVNNVAKDDVNLEISAYIDEAANIGTVTQTIEDEGAASNAIGEAEGIANEIYGTYAFGNLVAIDNLNNLVSDNSALKESAENEYVEYGATEAVDGFLGLENAAVEIEDAVDMLNDRYTAYTFAVVDGVIVATAN